MTITKLPYGVASIVKYGEVRYLIKEISLHMGPCYSLIGHKRLKSRDHGIAWIVHTDVTLIEAPTLRSWDMLEDVFDDE